jgi:quinate dehydrogenase
MPNKVAFLDLLDELSEEATAIGAVNTSFVRLDKHGNRRHVGTNTDCIGIREAILNQAPLASKAAQGRPVLVIGGGGAARSAIYSLWRWFGPSKIYIANRLKSEIDALVQFFKSTSPEMRLHPIITAEEARCIDTPYIVVGTIPDNPPREPGEILCRQICDTILRKDGKGIFLDMCYLPSPMTRLYISAATNGWQVVSGTDVLVRVCIAQQTLWLERSTNEVGMREAISALWEITQPQHTTQNSKL